MEAPATEGNNGTPTRLARGLVIMQCVLSGLAQLPVLKYVLEMQLAMVPYKALPRLRLWTLLSCAFFDLRPLAAIMNVAVCAVCARPAELAIGRRSMCAMIALATTVAAVFVSASTLVVYAAVPMGKLIFAPIATAAGVNLALLMVLKQQIAEHEVGVGGVRLRVNYTPLVYSLLLVLLACMGQLGLGSLVMSLISGHAAWAYLRYWRRDPMTSERGDPTEAFAFATLFPDPIRPFVSVASNVMHLVCTPALKCLQSLGSSALTGNGVKQDLVNSIVQDRGSAIDAERRRQRALKSLDERIAGSQSEPAL